MFALTVKFKAVKGKEEQLIAALRQGMVEIRKNEPGTLMYDLHRNPEDPTEIFLYERYADKQAWEVAHMPAPYIQKVLAELPNFLEGEAEVTQYDIIEVK